MTQQDRDFAILNAVRSLDAGDADVLRAYLAVESPDAANALGESETALAQMARALPQQAAPPALKQRLLAKVQAEPRQQEQEAPVVAGRIGRTTTPLLLRYAAMIILGVVVGIVAWQMFYAGPRESNMTARIDQLDRLVASGQVTLIQFGKSQSQPKARGRVYWDTETKKWHVYVFDLAPPGQGKEYELWIIPQGQNPIPAKMFNVNEKGEAHLVVDVPGNAGLQLTAAITDEPAGPLQPAPTGTVHLAGSVQ